MKTEEQIKEKLSDLKGDLEYAHREDLRGYASRIVEQIELVEWILK